MENFILSFRKFSLRWMIVIAFAISFVFGFISVVNGRPLVVTSIVSAISYALIYIIFAVYAIDDNKKAVIASYIFIAAYILSIIGSFSTLNSSSDIASMLAEELLTGSDSIEYWVHKTVNDLAPYSILMSLLMLFGFIYSIKHVNKRFLLTWWAAIVVTAVQAFGLLVLFISDDFDSYVSFNQITLVLALIFIIMLFINGGKSPNTKGVTLPTQAQATASAMAPIINNDITSKSDRLLKLKELLDAGVLTQEEFNSEKKKILNL